MTPNTIYYLILYALVIAAHGIRTQRRASEPYVHSKQNYIHVSFEVLYTSAGMVVLLLARLDEWIPAIMVGYMVLFLISNWMDWSGSKIAQQHKSLVHGVIVALVIGGTVYSFENLLAEPEVQPIVADDPRIFRVAFPYLDVTLDRHLGTGELGNRQLFHSATVDATSREEAVRKAREDFRMNVVPFLENVPQSPYNIVPGDDVVVEAMPE